MRKEGGREVNKDGRKEGLKTHKQRKRPPRKTYKEETKECQKDRRMTRRKGGIGEGRKSRKLEEEILLSLCPPVTAAEYCRVPLGYRTNKKSAEPPVWRNI